MNLYTCVGCEGAKAEEAFNAAEVKALEDMKLEAGRGKMPKEGRDIVAKINR